jgi:cyclopropane-fatty-acyl-phospholipid synthase
MDPKPEPTMATATLSSAATTVDVLQELFGALEPRNFAVRLWDGTTWTPPGAVATAFTLVLSRPGALRRILRAGTEAALAEAYLSGDVALDGDIYAVPAFGRALLAREWTLGDRARLALRIRRLPSDDGAPTAAGDGAPTPPRLRGRLHSVERDRVAVTHHYDVSNRFYRLFLDRRMVYSCAAFRDPDEPLETAQLRKLDLICRKLRLRSGARFLDIGCGWGALILHAAGEYGVDATGITLSERQAEVARERIREAGLEDRCRVEIRDYRTLPDEAAFDHIASVGMFEHVGRDRAADYFTTLHRLLRPGGTYLHHAITGDTPRGGARGSLSDRYVFPDHELIPVPDTLAFARAAGLEARDVETLREHYALTLRHWVSALEIRREEAVAEVGEATWRAWRLVFAGAAVDFESGRQGLAQVLFVRPRADGSAGLPLGRWDWYESDGGAAGS